MHKMLWEQVQGMYAADQELPVQQQTGVKINDLKTEKDAGDYIKLVMQRLRGAAAAATEGSK
jgi:hypothetical protein